MSKEWRVAVVGATGLVGETMIQVLEERKFPVRELFPLASQRSVGKSVEFNGRHYPVEDLASFDFKRADIGLFSAGSEISAEFAPKAATAGCIVIDNTAQFRYDADIPLIVPEVNAHAIAQYRNRNIIANPNCSTIQMVVALKPIHDAVGIERINVATYQSVSGAGKEAVEELAGQTAALLNGKPITPRVMPKQIAFNCLPHIDRFQDNGYTREEMKMFWETRKILEDDTIRVNATTVRVPVRTGHSVALHIRTERPTTVADIEAALRDAPGLEYRLADGSERHPMPLDVEGRDPVLAGRLRAIPGRERGFALWLSSDNLRKGAALNAIQSAAAADPERFGRLVPPPR